MGELRGASVGGADGIPAATERELDQLGPYLLPTVNLVLVNFAFRADATRAALPPTLEPSDSNSGFALFYTSAGSDGFLPGSAFYVGVFLKGRDAPDGSPGIFVADGYYSNEANLEASRNYSSRFQAGWSGIEVKDDVITGQGGPKGKAAVRFKLRRLDNQPPMMLGTHQYFGERAGGLTTYSLAFAARLFDCETVSFVVSSAASPILQRLLAPASVIRSSFVTGAPLYFSRPRPIASDEHIASPDASHVAVVDVLAHLGWGAVVVEEDARVVLANQQGRAFLESLLRSGRIDAVDLEEQTTLIKLIRAAAHAQGGPVQRMALHRPNGDLLLVQVANYRGGWKGHPTALLLISDPSAAFERSAGQSLELIGLTRAEARIATEIGKGRSARQAATALGLAESTVRSALKMIYAKLGVSNRAQLANMLAKV